MSRTCRVALSLSLLTLCAIPSFATTISTHGSTVTPSDNCGFIPSGTGWIRLHLKNDSLSASPTDLWAISGKYYPLRVLDLLLPSDAPSPTSIALDDSQTCGYTRSFGADECNVPGDGLGYIVNVGGLLSNIGFYASGGAGTIDVKLRSEGTGGPWHTYAVTVGEFVLGDFIDCQLASDGIGPGYISVVSP